MLFQPLDRQVDVAGRQIGRAAVPEVRAHRGQPATTPSLCNLLAVIESRYSPDGMWVNRHRGSIDRKRCSCRPATIAKDRREGDWVGSGDSACVDG